MSSTSLTGTIPPAPDRLRLVDSPPYNGKPQLSPEMLFWQWFVKTPGVWIEPLSSERLSIKINHAADRFNLSTLEKDCLLRKNAEHCPGKRGTIADFLAPDGSLLLTSCYRDNLITLLYQHRRENIPAA